MNTASVAAKPKLQISLPKSLIDVCQAQRYEKMRPDLDFKKAEYKYKFNQSISIYVQKLLEVLGLEGDQSFICPLPCVLKKLQASTLTEFLQVFIQDKIRLYAEQHPDTEVGFEHAQTFAFGVSKYIMQLKQPRMNSFDLNRLLQATEVEISYEKLVLILEKELKYQRLSEVKPKAPVSPAPALVISEEQMNQMCTKLHNDFRRQNMKIMERQREKYEAELNGCTFKPQVSERAKLYENDPSYGADLYVQKRAVQLQKENEARIIDLLNQVIEEAEGYNIKLTDQFLIEVKRDLEATSSRAVQKDIVRKISEQLQRKYQELERLNFEKKLATGQIQKTQLSFRPDEQVLTRSLTQSELYESQRKQAEKRAKTIQSQQRKEQLEKWKEIDEKVKRANLRAEIYKQFRRSGSQFDIDLRKVEQQYGREGVEAIMGSSGLQESKTEKGKDAVVLFSRQ